MNYISNKLSYDKVPEAARLADRLKLLDEIIAKLPAGACHAVFGTETFLLVGDEARALLNMVRKGIIRDLSGIGVHHPDAPPAVTEPG